jgi:hypothetical protein
MPFVTAERRNVTSSTLLLIGHCDKSLTTAVG